MAGKALAFLVLLSLAAIAYGDLYMQNPRGTNNRLNEADTDADNQNRLFDSQNNAKGGYCYGPTMYYYEHSQLQIQWTNQHGCNNPKLQCNLVIQYMCGRSDATADILIRDGTTTQSISAATVDDQAGGAYTFGQHESSAYYTDCATRTRNRGLFAADRETQGGLNLAGSATDTRQNNGGTQRGFECPEERDYYPYWHPSPWKDIAVLTDDTSMCDFFTSESQNVKSKNYCSPSPSKYNNEVDCTANKGTWTSQKSWGISAPACVQTPYNRDNHIGNNPSGDTNFYDWVLPQSGTESCISDNKCSCVLRMRYNLTSGDYDAWKTPFVDAKYNGDNSPVQQDPVVTTQGDDLQLALNTDQYARTFQDRSQVFEIRSRPSSIPSLNRVYNLNVRGKRGNIVQTYPATEYDFVPNDLSALVGDIVHFQWTGCDTNPDGNAGEGLDGTDRSNIVQISDWQKNLPANSSWIDSHTPMFSHSSLRYRMAYIDQTGCDNTTNNDQDTANCKKLNRPGANYFDGGAIPMNNTGTFHYMSTRNNNFTNRGQKARMTISPLLPPWAVALVVIGSVGFIGAGAVAGAMYYARSHPHSRLNEIFSKM